MMHFETTKQPTKNKRKVLQSENLYTELLTIHLKQIEDYYKDQISTITIISWSVKNNNIDYQ